MAGVGGVDVAALVADAVVVVAAFLGHVGHSSYNGMIFIIVTELVASSRAQCVRVVWRLAVLSGQ